MSSTTLTDIPILLMKGMFSRCIVLFLVWESHNMRKLFLQSTDDLDTQTIPRRHIQLHWWGVCARIPVNLISQFSSDWLGKVQKQTSSASFQTVNSTNLKWFPNSTHTVGRRVPHTYTMNIWSSYYNQNGYKRIMELLAKLLLVANNREGKNLK